MSEMLFEAAELFAFAFMAWKTSEYKAHLEAAVGQLDTRVEACEERLSSFEDERKA